jgi:single-strand DNA-binding protein
MHGNTLSILVNVATEPEFATAGDTQIANITGIWNDPFKKKDDPSRASFFDIKCFGKTAEIAQKYVQKGRQILIEGKIKQERWVDKNGGGNRSKHVVYADSLTLIGSANPSNDTQPQGSNNADSSDGGWGSL